MNERQRKSELFEKYMENTCTREEFDELIGAVKESDNLDEFDGAFKKNWEQAQHKTPPHTISWDGIYQNIVLRLWAIKKARQRFKYTALLLVICGAALFLYPRYTKPTEVTYLTEQTASAKTKVVTLADGTRVTLNANSELRYPENFNGDKREVCLIGEAYFQVFHNADKPFVIHSGNLLTHVLGTTFTVSAYPKSVSPLNVTVLTGKVAVKHEQANALAVLTRGQSATMRQGKSTFELDTLKNPEDAIAWIDDKLIFENADMKEVASVLSNKYGVTISIADDQLAAQHITAIFQGQTLSGILKAVTKITHTKYTNTDSTTYTILKAQQLPLKAKRRENPYRVEK